MVTVMRKQRHTIMIEYIPNALMGITLLKIVALKAAKEVKEVTNIALRDSRKA